jgi:enoyl-CoA hydratase
VALTTPSIECQRDGSVAILRINNPKLRNALSRSVLEELRRALDSLAKDPGVRALIIGSAVEGIFAAGGNIRELAALEGSRGGLEFAQYVQEVFGVVESFHWPVIAAINGHALGAGAELASATDIRVASETARLAFPHVGLGITPGLGGGQRLIRLIGRAHARSMILLGEPLTATEAWELGLVDRVVPSDKLWDVAMETARTLAAKPRHAIQLAKQAVAFSSQATLEVGCAEEALRFGLAFSTAWKES